MGLMDAILNVFAGTVQKSVARSPRRAHAYGIEASAKNNGMSEWSPAGRDDMNEDYLRNLYSVMERSFNLNANNADIRGHNQGRTARILGSGVVWQAAPIAAELGIDPGTLDLIAKQINQLRELHSEFGGMDASGKNLSEGLLQVKTLLTAHVLGSCLVHRVWRDDPKQLLPFAIELIPGSRISTPYSRMGDSHVHFGIEYADEYRSRIVGWHVSRVPRTLGDTSINAPDWDFIPAEDGSMLELIEPAGIDRALPGCVAVMRLIFNRGQMIEACVEAARNHANHHMLIEVAPGHNPFDEAADAADYIDTNTSPAMLYPEGWRNSDGIKERYLFNGEKATMNTAMMPGPDFRGFNDVADERMTRGLNTRKSEFTRTVDTSYSGGMQERQIDTPGVEQQRANFTCCWNKVHAWFLDACFLAGAVDMPNYNARTKIYWNAARKEFPGELPLNPVDHRNAQNMALASGQTDDITESEAAGTNYAKTCANRAKAFKMRREAEQAEGLEPMTLEPLNDLPSAKETSSESTTDTSENNTVDSTRRAGLSARPGSRVSQRRTAARI